MLLKRNAKYSTVAYSLPYSLDERTRNIFPDMPFFLMPSERNRLRWRSTLKLGIYIMSSQNFFSGWAMQLYSHDTRTCYISPLRSALMALHESERNASTTARPTKSTKRWKMSSSFFTRWPAYSLCISARKYLTNHGLGVCAITFNMPQNSMCVAPSIPITTADSAQRPSHIYIIATE